MQGAVGAEVCPYTLLTRPTRVCIENLNKDPQTLRESQVASKGPDSRMDEPLLSFPLWRLVW